MITRFILNIYYIFTKCLLQNRFYPGQVLSSPPPPHEGWFSPDSILSINFATFWLSGIRADSGLIQGWFCPDAVRNQGWFSPDSSQMNGFTWFSEDFLESEQNQGQNQPLIPIQGFRISTKNMHDLFFGQIKNWTALAWRGWPAGKAVMFIFWESQGQLKPLCFFIESPGPATKPLCFLFGTGWLALKPFRFFYLETARAWP